MPTSEPDQKPLNADLPFPSQLTPARNPAGKDRQTSVDYFRSFYRFLEHLPDTLRQAPGFKAQPAQIQAKINAL